MGHGFLQDGSDGDGNGGRAFRRLGGLYLRPAVGDEVNANPDGRDRDERSTESKQAAAGLGHAWVTFSLSDRVIGAALVYRGDPSPAPLRSVKVHP